MIMDAIAVNIMMFLYMITLFFILVYSLVQTHLVYHYFGFPKQKRKEDTFFFIKEDQYLPFVSVQLPIFNEMYVVERIIDAVAYFDYPREKLEIQVLDDSTDETVSIVANKVRVWQARGTNIVHLRRLKRTGFKAGALQEGLQSAKGEFIAIFDADFIPAPDFLKKTISIFKDEKIGMVQTCWTHINKDYSLLTQLQAFMLNVHFSIEQAGRNRGGYFMNFNGTGGIWRKKCIYDAGGWHADTLAEDLDLSYRAQLKGWKFIYLEDVKTPAELPPVMSALKLQQYRWTKGGAETARKNLLNILKSDIPLSTKLHATFHLLNSFMFVCVFLSSVLSIPYQIIKETFPNYEQLYKYTTFSSYSFLFLSFCYWVSSSREYKNKSKAIIYFMKTFPLSLSFFAGLSLHNTIAVVEGYLGIKTPFIRTPKFNIQKNNNNWKNNKYLTQCINSITILEGFFMFYFIYGIVRAFYQKNYCLLPFHLIFSLGFGLVFCYSISHSRK